jgi:hypothetical protein
MHYVTFPQKAQRKEELLCVRADSTDVKSNIFAKPLYDVAEVHTTSQSIGTTLEKKGHRNDLIDSKTKHR